MTMAGQWKVVYGLSIVHIFNHCERPRTHISRSRQ